MYVEFFFFFLVWNYYFISARWLPPLRINKVKSKSKSIVMYGSVWLCRAVYGYVGLYRAL